MSAYKMAHNRWDERFSESIMAAHFRDALNKDVGTGSPRSGKGSDAAVGSKWSSKRSVTGGDVTAPPGSAKRAKSAASAFSRPLSSSTEPPKTSASSGAWPDAGTNRGASTASSPAEAANLLRVAKWRFKDMVEYVYAGATLPQVMAYLQHILEDCRSARARPFLPIYYFCKKVQELIAVLQKLKPEDAWKDYVEQCKTEVMDL